MEVSTESAMDTFYRWVRQVAAPRRISKIPEKNQEQENFAADDGNFDTLLRRLQGSYHASHTSHLAIFRKRPTIASFTDSRLVWCSDI